MEVVVLWTKILVCKVLNSNMLASLLDQVNEKMSTLMLNRAGLKRMTSR